MKNWSKYNIFFEREDCYFLYCPLSNSFAKLSKDTYEYLKGRFENDLPMEDDELKETLRSMKSIDTDDELEIMKIRHLEDLRKFSRKSVSLTINPTLACNFRCGYCFEKEHQNKYMTPEIEDKIVEYVSNCTESNRVFVTWFGGEPLLGFKTIRSLTGKLMALGKDYEAGMITNGYLLTEDIARQLTGLKIKSIQITLDGKRDIHDSRRFLAGGGRTFDRIVENIRNCQRIAPEVRISIRVNVDNSNKNDFVDIRNELMGMDLPNIDIHPGIVQSDETDSACTACNREEVISLLLDLYLKHGLNYIDLFPKNRWRSCVARNIASIVIGPDGELYDCWNDVGDIDRVIGMLGKKPSNIKLHLEYLSGKSQFEDPDCLECRRLPVCSGGCQNKRLKSKNKEDNCILGKNHMEDFLYMHYIAKQNQKIN